MNGKPAYGSGMGRMVPALLCLAGLAACAAPTDSKDMRMSVDGVPMKVYFQKDVVDYIMVTDTNPATGETVEITPSPITDGYVVVRNDGKPTTEADEDRARQAADHFCESRGKRSPARLQLDPLQGSDAMVWYFGGCP
ncbi:hypothetical protein [Paracoccus sp. (in: a-proteobacteria)]|uniref:hypothetical protein n=1 Tax=Paracoccus sp. TaxID=267 RepID=UPI0035ADCD30